MAPLGQGQSVAHPPLFDGNDYHYWAEIMKLWIKSKCRDVWGVVERGNNQVTGSYGDKSDNVMNDKEKKKMEDNDTAKLYLIMALSRSEYDKVSGCSTAKEIWDTLAVAHEGTSEVKETKIDMLVHKYELFKMDENESIENMFARFQTIIGELKALGKIVENKDLVRKILRSLPKRWRPKVTAIKEAKDLKTLKLDELLGSLKTHELELDADEPPKRMMTALKVQATSSGSYSRKHRKKEKVESESEQESSNEDELDLMTEQFKRFLKKFKRS